MEDVPGAEAPATRSCPARTSGPPTPVDPTPWLMLSLAAPLGPATCRRLAEAFPDPAALRTRLDAVHGADRQAAAASRRALGGPHGPLTAAHLAALDAAATRHRVDAALDWAASADDHHLVPIDDPTYPGALRLTADPPPLLYVRGARTALEGPAVAVIGSRRATRAGRERAHVIAHDLAAAGIVVVSGLALGTDAAAHAGALSRAPGGAPGGAPGSVAGGGSGTGRGVTLAFTGTGVDRIYPHRHAPLAQAILEHGGAMASEFPLGHPPRPWCFPQRNRLISGTSLGVVVVEATLPSGSLTTARHALEQGREVMAVPGQVEHPGSRGCHALISDGATLVCDAADVLRALAGPLSRTLLDATSIAVAPSAPPAARGGAHPPTDNMPAAITDPVEQRLWRLLGNGSATLERLVARADMAVPPLLAALGALELGGLVTLEHDGRYARRTTPRVRDG